jgi:hypothetical protein
LSDERSRLAKALREEGGSLLEVAGAVGFAIAQPVLAPFGESPETFLAVGATSTDVVRFALVVAIVPIFVLWGLAALTRVAGEQVRAWVQAVLVGGLLALAASAFARSVGAPGAVRALVAVAVGVGVGVLVQRRWVPVRLFLRYTSPVPILLVAMFLFASPVSSLVSPPSGPEVGEAAANGDRPPIVMVVFDEVPTSSLLDGEGGIQAELFPNIARIAQTSTWYRDHTTGGAATLQSLPVLHTGQMPEDATDDDFPIYADYPDNLFTALGDTYEIVASEYSSDLCPPSICPDLAPAELADDVLQLTLAPPKLTRSSLSALTSQAFSLWRSQVWPLADDFDAGYVLGGDAATDETVRQTLEAVNRIEPPTGDRPRFDYFHFALPHQPWFLLPSGRTHDAPEVPFGNEFVRTWPDGQIGEDLAAAGEARMHLQLQWADRALGVAIDRLEEQGRWDDALVVFTADHGFSFEPGTSARLAATKNQVPLAWAPLFVKLPGQTDAQVVDDPVMALDVLPTILDVVGIDPTWELEGVSLLDGPPPADRDRPFVIVEDTDFATNLRERVVVLDADGLTETLARGKAVDAGDPLAAWRHGRHGDLLGRRATDLGVCSSTGPTVELPVTSGWRNLTAGRLGPSDPLPLWHDGRVSTDQSIDVVATVDGVVVGWGATLPAGSTSRLGILFVDDLVLNAEGDPRYFQVVDDDGCRLRPLEGP